MDTENTMEKKKKYRLTFIISNRRPTEAATGGVL